MPFLNRGPRRIMFACLSAILLGLVATAARAQVDCTAGFNCGRVIISERDSVGAANLRIMLQNLDGSQPTLVWENIFGYDSSLGLITFDAAARKLYFTISSVTFGQPQIYVVNVDGTGLTNLTDNACFNELFSISPDGMKIAFRSNCGPSDDDGKIWIMDIDGGNAHLLTADPLVSDDVTANSHMYPSISPDGAFVVFTSQASSSGSQQVYRSTLDGKTVVALTNLASDIRDNGTPEYLPNGDIVFVSRRDALPESHYSDVYRMDGNGFGRLRLSNNIVGAKQYLTVSPTGNHVLFTNSAEFRSLYVAKTDGTGAIALWDDEGDLDEFGGFPHFSPDGTRVAFQLCVHTADGCRYVTRVMDIDGGNPITYEDPARDIQFKYFGRPNTDADGDGVVDAVDNCLAVPNGYRVAFASNRVSTSNYELWTQDLYGGELERLSTNNAIDAEPNFDASGAQLVFQSSRINNRLEIYSMKSDGSQVWRLTNAAGDNITPTFSPDASKVTFIASREGGARNVYVMNADGSEQTKLTTNQGVIAKAYNPVFNHDGTRIAFDSDRGQIGSANHDIFSINLQGGDEQRLTTDVGRDIAPSYSRDGSRIVFISFRDGESANGEIYIMNADGSNARRITHSTVRETQPEFTPDGMQIVYVANTDTDSEIYAINIDGTGQRLVANSDRLDLSPTVAPQPDTDGDGIGDACEVPDNGLPTPVGTSVVVTSPDGSANFSEVTTAGVTTFLPITVGPDDMPEGYSLCDTCAGFDITTTATIVPPITICLVVPASLSTEVFQQLRLLHGESGQWVDRTTQHIDEPGVPRQVCGVVDSLSPFALATPTGADDIVFSDGFDDQG